MDIAEIRDLSDHELTGDALILMYNVVVHGMRVSEEEEEFCESRLFLEPSANTRVKFKDVQPNELDKFIKFLGEDGMKHEVNSKNATLMLIEICTQEACAEISRLLSSGDEKVAKSSLETILNSSRSVLPDMRNPIMRMALLAHEMENELEASGIQPAKGVPLRNPGIPMEKLIKLKDGELTGESLALMYQIVVDQPRVPENVSEFCESRLFLMPSAETMVDFSKVPKAELDKFIRFLGNEGEKNEISARDAASMLIAIGTPGAYSEISRMIAFENEKVSQSAFETMLKFSGPTLHAKNNPIMKLALLANDLQSQVEKAGIRSHTDVRLPEAKEKIKLR